MKHLRASSKSGMAAKLARMRGGDVGRVTKGMPSRDGAKGYATGGVVNDEDGGPIDGVSAKKSMGKPGRMKGGKGPKDGGKKGTNVNVIIMGKDSAPAAPPMAGPPGPPMPPGPPGGPPPPMRASGGRVLKGKGSGGGLGRLAKMKAYGKAGKSC